MRFEWASNSTVVLDRNALVALSDDAGISFGKRVSQCSVTLARGSAVYDGNYGLRLEGTRSTVRLLRGARVSDNRIFGLYLSGDDASVTMGGGTATSANQLIIDHPAHCAFC